MPIAQKVSTCLWFDEDGEDAAKFYTALIPNSRIVDVSRYGPGAPLPEGTALMVQFELDGATFQALNGGPMFPHTEAASLVVQCDSQDEIDRLWSALTAAGGAESMCGWLKDKYGLSWQIVPRRIGDWLSGPDKASAQRAMAALMGMKKLNIAQLEAAYRGR